LNFSQFDADGEPTWKLYETTAAVAVLSNPPRSPDFDPPINHAAEFGVGGSIAGDGFYWDHFNRRTLVLYPSNAGILHAFDGETGAERFGYIPDDVMTLAPGELPSSRDTLKDFVQLVVNGSNNIINHRYTLTSSPNVEDVFLRADNNGDDEWHSVAAFGRGRGGRFLTALDFTDAADNPSSLRLLWSRGNREGINDGPLDGLGETWSVPVFGNVDTRTDPSATGDRIDQWLLFAGGGYGCDNSATEGQFLFAFRAEDGSLYHRAPVDSLPVAAIAKNGLPAPPTVYNPHLEDEADNKDFVTRVYIPDLQGRVWKLNTNDPDPANWTMNVFAEMGPDHPFTAGVALLKDPFQPNRVFVVAGSGGDRRAPFPPEGFRLRTWIDNDPDSANTTQYAASDPPLFDLEFGSQERMFVTPVTVGEIGDPANLEPVLFAATSVETLDETTCVVSFDSFLYSVGIETGLPLFDLDTTQPGEDRASVEGKIQGLAARDGNLYLSQSGGLGVAGGVSIWGDSTFDDDPAPAGIGQFTLQLLIEGFRISPF
jgi:outer membrane protein assembly factor BamB